MPIRPDLRCFYGREWRAVTRPRILERAGNGCEGCGKPNGARVSTVSGVTVLSATDRRYFMWWRQLVYAPGDVWLNQFGNPLIGLAEPDGQRSVRVVLTVAHLNHKAGDDRDENLAALCQWCHLTYDLTHHKHSREARKDRDRPLFSQFGEVGKIDHPENLKAGILPG